MPSFKARVSPYYPSIYINRGMHGLKSNRVNWPFWRIDLVNRPNSYLEIYDLHTLL